MEWKLANKGGWHVQAAMNRNFVEQFCSASLYCNSVSRKASMKLVASPARRPQPVQ